MKIDAYFFISSFLFCNFSFAYSSEAITPDQTFLQAAASGNTEKLIKAIDMGADLNTLDNEDSALTLAALYNRKECLKLILDCAVVTDTEIIDYWNAVNHAFCENHREILRIFTEHPYRQSFSKEQAKLSFLYAAEYGFLGLLKFCLSSGVPINSTGRLGRTALHLASRYGHHDIVKFLLEAGIDWSLKDFLDHTAHFLSITFEKNDIQNALEKWPKQVARAEKLNRERRTNFRLLQMKALESKAIHLANVQQRILRFAYPLELTRNLETKAWIIHPVLPKVTDSLPES